MGDEKTVQKHTPDMVRALSLLLCGFTNYRVLHANEDSIVDALQKQLELQRRIGLNLNNVNINEHKSGDGPSLLVDIAQYCIDQFHAEPKRTLTRAINNKTLHDCLVKAILQNDNPIDSTIKSCLQEGKSLKTCLLSPATSSSELETTVIVDKTARPVPEWLSPFDPACQKIAGGLSKNKSLIVEIVQKKSQAEYDCVAKLLRTNPKPKNEVGMNGTATCIEQADNWKDREDSMFFLELRTDDLMKILLKCMTAGIFMILQFTMLGLGCEIKISEVKKHAKKPIGAIIAVSAQFGVMPLAAFGISRALDLDFYPSIALIICGCCPGGNLSNMLAYAVRGDMNLSILMTTCSSIGGLIAMPLLTMAYGEWTKAIFKAKAEAAATLPGAESVNLDFELTIPYKTIILNLLFTLIPCGIGIIIANFKPTWVRVTQKIAGGLMLITTVVTITDIIYIFGWDLAAKFEPKVIIACALLPLVGYVVGYTVARLAGQKANLSRTIAIETGCHNVQLCGVILRLGFLWCNIGIYFLITLIYIGFQIGWALVGVILVRYKEIKLMNQKKKGMLPDITVKEIQERYGDAENFCETCEQPVHEVESLLDKSTSSKC